MSESSTTTSSAQAMDWAQLMANLANLTPEQKALLQTPAIRPPNGTTPNFTNPPSIKNLQYGIVTPLLEIIIIFAGNCIYVKTLLAKKCT